MAVVRKIEKTRWRYDLAVMIILSWISNQDESVYLVLKMMGLLMDDSLF